MTLETYMKTLWRYGYTARYSHGESATRDHLFVESRPWLPICFVHSRKQIKRMTPDDLEGQLMVRMFVL